ncbi:MAG: hypothetical protein PHS02_01190 [Candidatus ainarchaeum sp.]|nr:hypothetical protein [Candidatus ainarchaeum sp.]
MSHVTTFREYLLREFGIALPREIVLQEQENVIRVFSKTLMMLKPAGYMGFVAGKVGTNGIEAKGEFIQLFGKHATKNILELDEIQAKSFVENEFVEINSSESGWKIAKFQAHVLGIGRLKDGKLYSDFIGKGRKRVENSLNPSKAQSI